MASNVQELRPKSGDTEKITMNLGYIDLGRIDLMVQEGFYSNRTDFIRTAVRNQLERHAEVVKQSTARKSLELGLRHYTRDDLETVRAAGQTLHIHVLGLASIAMDVTPELARGRDGFSQRTGSAPRQRGRQGRSSRQDGVRALIARAPPT